MNQFLNVLSHKQVAPPIIIRAYAHQFSRLMPTNIPARGVNLGFSIGLGGKHLKYDRFKMYIDQGVHFQIKISKSIFLIHFLSPICKTKYFEMRSAQLISHKIYFTAWGCTYWASAHRSNIFLFSVLGMSRNE